jgi:toxin ParE1/3/4
VKPHAFHPEADAEYALSAETYASHGAELGGRFYDEIERVIAEIREAPHRFREYDPPARRLLAKDFPFAVVYLNEPDRVWIVAVMPLHRDPQYWKHRLG